MADESGLSEFLNTSGDSRTVDVLNPVNWSGLGKALGGSLVVFLSTMVQSVFVAYANAIEAISDGLTKFIGGYCIPSLGDPCQTYRQGLVDVTIGAAADAYATVWDISLQSFGVFGYLVAVLITLGSIGLLSIGLRRAAERFVGVR